MGSVEILSEEVTVELRKLGWLIGESSPLKLTIIRRSAHRTEGFVRGVISLSS